MDDDGLSLLKDKSPSVSISFCLVAFGLLIIFDDNVDLLNDNVGVVMCCVGREGCRAVYVVRAALVLLVTNEAQLGQRLSIWLT